MSAVEIKEAAIARGHAEYAYDKTGDPILEWIGDEKVSTTARGENQSENAQRN